MTTNTMLTRSRLVGRIGLPELARVTLVTAPAGYGKSTLVEQWARCSERSVAWVALGPGSNNPLRFRTQLAGAIETAAAKHEISIGEDGSLDAIVEALERLLPEEQRPVIVLDDYHLIENQDIHAIMDGLIDDLPEGANLILISRAVPPVSLGKLHMQGLVRHLSEADLSFTREELEAVIALEAPARLTEAQVATLAERTDGWIAGIRLALASLDRVDPATVPSVIDIWPASRWLDDFIVEEVLAALPEEVRNFVLRTVILPELAPALCNAVLGIETSARLIDEVRQRLVFVRPGDSGDESLVYHALFAESTGRIADRALPASDRRERHRRAALWYERQGRLEAAVDQAIAAEDWELARRWVRSLCQDLSGSDLFHSHLHWIGRLPERQVLVDPELAHKYIFALHYTYRLGEAQRAFAVVEPLWLASDDPVQFGYLASSRCAAATRDGDFELALQLAEEALAHYPLTHAAERLHLWGRIMQLASYLGDVDGAEHAYRQAVGSLDQLSGGQWWYLSQLELTRGNGQALRGDLHQAHATLQDALDRFSGLRRAQKAKFRFRLAAIALEWNDLDAAEQHIRAIEQDAGSFTDQLWRSEQLLIVARIFEAMGNKEELCAVLRRVRYLVDRQEGQRSHHRYEVWQVNSWLQSGKLDMARGWASRVQLSDQPWIRMPGDVDPRLTRVRVALVGGAAANAETELRKLIEQAQATNRWAEMIPLCMWQVVTCLELGDEAGALAALRTALHHGMRGGFVRSFMTPGYDLKPFLARVEHDLSPHEAEYARRVLRDEHAGEPALVSRSAPDAVRRTARLGRDSPLSVREIEVLRPLHEGCTNQQIAERLFISERTVRKHVGNILRKLGVPNRTAAVMRAVELDLL